MPFGKAFILRIEIDIHSLHGQQIRVCHGDSIALKVQALNATAVTMPSAPPFPVRFREKLIFEKVIHCVTTLADVQEHLTKEPLKMELLQWPKRCSRKPTIIAHFRSKLSNVLFPALANKNSDGGSIKLLMEPTEAFTESVGLKVEVSTKTIVEETAYGLEPSRTSERSQVLARGISCGSKQGDSAGCSCHATCGCDYRQKAQHPGTSRVVCRRSQRTECNQCCVCSCYEGYFEPKPSPGHRSKSCSCMRGWDDSRETQRHRPGKRQSCQRSPRSLSSCDSYSCKSKFASDAVDRQVPRRQIFYENLDHFYRQLRDNKPDRTCT